jgi:hypothetical protein
MKLAFYVDFNHRERRPDGSQAVGISFGAINPSALSQKLQVGLPVIVYDEDIRCDGVLKKGEWLDGWVADLVPGTNKGLSEGEFEQLLVSTKRAALHSL